MTAASEIRRSAAFIRHTPTLPVRAHRRPNGTVYLGDPGATVGSAVIRSEYLSDRSGTGRCEPEDAPVAIDGLIPVVALADLYDVFAPPFRLVAAPTATAPSAPTETPTPETAPACCGDCDASGLVTVDELIRGVNHLLFGCP